jgi:type I restriction enzyme S subunit
MRKVSISTIADVAAGQGAPKQDEFSGSGGTPFVRAGSLEDLLSGKKTETDLELVPAVTAKKRKLKLYPKGSILFAKSGMSATLARIYVLQNPAHVVSHLAILAPKDEVHGEYLRLALKKFPPSVLIKDPAYPAISLGEIQDYKIPVPEELGDQKRIAHLLGKVEGLIARRKQHLQQLDDLLKSVFLEMFGDPVRNEKGWDSSEIEKLCEAVIDCPHSTPVYSVEKTGYFCVRSGDIVDGYLDLSKTLHVGRDIYEERIKRYTPQIGDIVYSREGGRLGNAARILGNESICLGQRIMLFKVSDKKNGDFLWALLESRSFKRKLQGLVGGGAAPRVNIKDLKKITVIKPPSDIQTQFSSIANRIDQLKSRYQQSLADLESLYGALSQKAFKGELDLSRVLLPKELPDKVEEDISQSEAAEPDNSDMIRRFSMLDIPGMSVKETRRGLLQQWFDEWVGDTAFNQEISPESFWQRAKFSALDHLGGDDETEDFTAEDYNIFKEKLFSAIEGGLITQTRNTIEVGGKFEFGNKIILKRAG